MTHEIVGGQHDGLTCRMGRHYWEVGGANQVEQKIAGREIELALAEEPRWASRCVCDMWKWGEWQAVLKEQAL